MLTRAGGMWPCSWLYLRSGAGPRGPYCPGPCSVCVPDTILPHLAVDPLPTSAAHGHTYADTYM